MATFKAEVQNKRADGTYNVRIRLTHNRAIKRISTNIYVRQEDLTKSLKIKNPNIINAANTLINQCMSICNNIGFSIVDMDIEQLAEHIKMKLKGEEKFTLDFIAFAREEAKKMKASTGAFYETAINALIRFIGTDSIDINKIDTNFLKRFQSFIETEPSQTGSNRKETTAKAAERPKGRAVSAYLGCMRAIYNRAKEEYNDEDRGIVKIPYYPFKKISIKAETITRKRALLPEQIQAIIDLQYEGGRFDLAKDCFLISFALCGMNSADLYNLTYMKNGIITYNRLKTAGRRADKAEMQIRIEDCVKSIINKYLSNNKESIFNFCKKYANNKNFNKALNTGLKLIGNKLDIEDLEFYAARHSWATIARSKAVGIDKATVHEGLNHVDKDMKITDIYIDRDWSVIWEANKKVLDMFDWSAVQNL
jgi:integrase